MAIRCLLRWRALQTTCTNPMSLVELLSVSQDPYSNMKTTIDISDSLLDKARRVAAGRGTTVKALVEAGLRQVLADSGKAPSFKLRDASFQGEGLQAGVDGQNWAQMRELAYAGRGA